MTGTTWESPNIFLFAPAMMVDYGVCGNRWGGRGKESDTPSIYANGYKHAQMQVVENLCQSDRPLMNADDAVIERPNVNSPLGKVQSSFALNATIDRTEARSFGGDDSADLSFELRCQSVWEIEILREMMFRTSCLGNEKNKK